VNGKKLLKEFETDIYEETNYYLRDVESDTYIKELENDKVPIFSATSPIRAKPLYKEVARIHKKSIEESKKKKSFSRRTGDCKV